MKGKFITFEGGEGSGKTTIIDRLVLELENRGFSVCKTREPGGVKIAEDIRNIILDCNNTSMCSETEALLYAASRMQHLHEKVIPALNSGCVVICDRYLDSSLVYQGIARNLGIDAVLKANCFALDYMPDTTFFIDVAPEVGLARLTKRQDKLDRLDRESIVFHNRVYNGYKQVASMYKERIVSIDGTKEKDDVFNEVLTKVLTLLEA